MPNTSRSVFSQHEPNSRTLYDLLAEPDTVAEQSTSVRHNGNKRKKGRSKDRDGVRDANELSADEVAATQSPTPRPTSIVGQIPYSFPRSQRRPTPPVLEALGSTEKVSDPDVPFQTDPWAQALPYGRSPPVGPTKDKNMNTHSASARPIRGGFSNKSPPLSPPQRKSRPVSHGSGLRPVALQQASADAGYHYPTSAYGSSPPLPHLVQPHFYGAPDMDLALGNRRRALSADHATSFVGFNQIPSALEAKRALLLGSENRLDILAFDKKESRPIGSLGGLGGIVLDAVFLTWEHGEDPFHHLRPLIAVTIHGPKTDDSPAPGVENNDLEHSDILAGIPAPASTINNGLGEEFQTRVEIFSLVQRSRLAILLKTQPVPMQPGLRGFTPTPPPAVGDLHLDARGNFVTVSSGTSGEIFVFGIESSAFRCLGKFWTTIQAKENRRSSSSTPYADRDISPADLHLTHKPCELPILSLSSRWLAICPPGPASRPTLGASVPVGSVSSKVPGLDSYSAPPRPSETCTIDSPDAPSLLNRVARGVAQEMVKGALWLGDQGLQSWNSYWKKDQSTPSQISSYSQPIHSPEQTPAFFPPTHGQETRNLSDPELVSIVDLQLLQHVQGRRGAEGLTPLATFQPPGGCSFLSFAPDGLSLFTASRKGDVQYVWDLMQIKHCRAAAFTSIPLDAAQNSNSTVSPCVRQIAKFPRLTSSTLVDVVWETPVGDRLAVVTRNGTVHVFDLPTGAFQWPPLRRATRLGPVSAPTSPAVHPQREEPEATGYLASAMKFATKTQPILANLRGRAPSVGGGVSTIGTNSIGYASATGVRSGKAVAAGLSQSLGVAAGTVNTFRHAGDSRVHLSRLATDPARSRVAWDTQSDQHGMLIIDGATVRCYRVRRTTGTGGHRQRQSVVDAQQTRSTKIPEVGQLATIAAATPTGQIDANTDTVSGYWKLKPVLPSEVSNQDLHPLSRAEIETNAPYQPFHSDRRVNLFVYSEASDYDLDESRMPTASAIFGGVPLTRTVDPTPTAEKWVFGTELPSTKLNVRSSSYDISDDQEQAVSSMYRRTTMEGGGEDEQIVSTTKTKKVKKSAMAGTNEMLGDEEFFEDDMEILDHAGDRV